MAMGKSFNKSILFVLGIVLVVSAFSGCTDADAPSTLADEPALTDEESALTDEEPALTDTSAVTNEPTNTENSDTQSSGAELYKELLAQDDPEAFKQLIGMNINDLKIKGLGIPTVGSLEAIAENRSMQLHWYNEDIEPAGLTEYIEIYDGGLLLNLLFSNGENGFHVIGKDEKINGVSGSINGQRFSFDDRHI